jgi:hypothetical protein
MQPIPSCAQSCARSLSRNGLSHTPAAADERRVLAIVVVLLTMIIAQRMVATNFTPQFAIRKNRPS